MIELLSSLFPLATGSEEAYFERSSIKFVDKFSFPVIIFQGLEDKVHSYIT